MKALVLGGTGYIGSRLSKYLRDQGHDVRIASRRSRLPPWLGGFDFARVRGVGDLKRAFQGRDIVYDLALPDERQCENDPATALEAGGPWTWKVVDQLTKVNPKCAFLLLSTFHVYGAHGQGAVNEETPVFPIHPYGLCRAQAENIVRLFQRRKGLNALCVRLSNAFGAPESAAIPRWSLVFNDLCLQAVTSGRLVLKTPGTQRRNFITLEDTVGALAFLAERRGAWPSDGFIHLGSRLHLSIREVAQRVRRVAERTLGRRIALSIPPARSRPDIRTLAFDTGRLAALGFSWLNSVDQEIEDTLVCYINQNRGQQRVRVH